MALFPAHAYTDGASSGRRGPGGYGVVLIHGGGTVELSGGEADTTNQRMEVTAACVALEALAAGQEVTVFSDSSYLVNCMRRRWHETWRAAGWVNARRRPVANRDLWERLLAAVERHESVAWKKVRGHQKKDGPHRAGNDRADKLAVAAKLSQT
ncbi:ribonuclease H family protein [Rubrobacter indicoceani]|uniref:ribonuclease H family protein n=1 Tax=Rubrobacter indicoceani TaxID=2051957 RepID=UPI000E5BD7F0|nr:ribonuclease H [Rubrobacter indicoceani]